MAIDSRIALGAQAPDTNTAIRGGLLNADTIQKMQENKATAPLRNKLLEAQVGGAEQKLSDAQTQAELTSMVMGGEELRGAYDRNGREGLIEAATQRIDAGPTVEGGRGMQDTIEFREMAFDPNTTDEELLAELDRVRDLGVRTNILKPSSSDIASADQVQSSRILADGTTVMTMKSGGTQVTSSEGNVLSGADRSEAIKKANEEEIRISGSKSSSRAEGSKVGGQLGQFQNDINTWDVTKKGVASAFPDIQGILKESPGSSFSNVVGKLVSATVGNTEGQDAQAQVQQIGALLLQTVPIPPGPQSEVELANRKQTYGDLENPNISVATKTKLIENYFRFQEAKADAARAKIEGEDNSVPEPKQAPTASIQWLEQNNSATNREFFKKKYGYLPEGY